MPSIALARLSVDALGLVTRIISGEDLMRLYLCGNAQLNGLLELGGVTHVDCASDFQCVAYKRGKREKWAGFDLTRPNSFSLSYWRFKRLRCLDLYVRSLNDILKNAWIAEIASLQTLTVHVGHAELSATPKVVCLPPNLTAFTLRCQSSLGSLRLSFSLPGSDKEVLPPALTHLDLPSTIAFDVVPYLPKTLVHFASPQFLLGKQALPLAELPLSLTNLQTHVFSISSLLDVTPRSSSPSHGFISSGTAQMPDHSNMTLHDFNGMLRNLLPPCLQTLNLSATSLPDYSVLPTTITDLTLHSHIPVTTRVDWHPTQLLVLDLRYSHFSAKVASSEGIETIQPWYDWIYGNHTLIELTLRYSEPSEDDTLDTRLLPSTLCKLSLVGPQKLHDGGPHHLPSPINFPPSLTSLCLTVPPALLKCSSVPCTDQSALQGPTDLERFPPLKTLKLSSAFWHLPRCDPIFSSLIHLELDHLSTSQFSEITDWPPHLRSLTVSSFWGAVYSDFDVSTCIPNLPRSLTSLHLALRGITLHWVTSWPPQLAYVTLPSARLSLNSFFKLPTSLVKLTCTRVSISSIRDVDRLKEFCETHPGASLQVASWVLPASRVPMHVGSINPVKTLQTLWSQVEFADNNLLTILNWSISKD